MGRRRAPARRAQAAGAARAAAARRQPDRVRRRLVDDLWGEDGSRVGGEDGAHLRLAAAQGACPRTRCSTRPPGYALEIDPTTHRPRPLRAAAARGRAALDAGNAAARRAAVREALALWRGTRAGRVPRSRSRASRRRSSTSCHLACLEDRIDADLALGRHAELVGELESLVSRQPAARAACARSSMLALYRSGRQADALADYQRFRAHARGRARARAVAGAQRARAPDPAPGPGRSTSSAAPAAAPLKLQPSPLRARAATSRSPTRSSATGRSTSCFVHGWVCCFQPGWEWPALARFYRGLRGHRAG